MKLDDANIVLTRSVANSGSPGETRSKRRSGVENKISQTKVEQSEHGKKMNGRKNSCLNLSVNLPIYTTPQRKNRILECLTTTLSPKYIGANGNRRSTRNQFQSRSAECIVKLSKTLNNYADGTVPSGFISKTSLSASASRASNLRDCDYSPNNQLGSINKLHENSTPMNIPTSTNTKSIYSSFYESSDETNLSTPNIDSSFDSLNVKNKESKTKATRRTRNNNGQWSSLSKHGNNSTTVDKLDAAKEIFKQSVETRTNEENHREAEISDVNAVKEQESATSNSQTKETYQTELKDQKIKKSDLKEENEVKKSIDDITKQTAQDEVENSKTIDIQDEKQEKATEDAVATTLLGKKEKQTTNELAKHKTFTSNLRCDKEIRIELNTGSIDDSTADTESNIKENHNKKFALVFDESITTSAITSEEKAKSSPKTPQRYAINNKLSTQVIEQKQTEFMALKNEVAFGTFTGEMEDEKVDANSEVTELSKDVPLIVNNELNNYMVNSPVASLDSAKGSSVATAVLYEEGELYYGKMITFNYWPCIVCPDAEGQMIRTVSYRGKLRISVHVSFLADNGRHNWVPEDGLMEFSDLAYYTERVKAIKASSRKKGVRYNKMYMPTVSRKEIWLDAIDIGMELSKTDRAERLDKFYELLEKSNSKTIRNKKVLRKPVDELWEVYKKNEVTIRSISNGNAINLKRERSISPISPAYSPVRISKRFKVDNDNDEGFVIRQSDEVHKESPVEVNPVEFISENIYDEDFKKFHFLLKEFVMDDYVDPNIEDCIFKAIWNIWGLRSFCAMRKEESENNWRGNTSSSSSYQQTSETNTLQNRSKNTISLKRFSSRLNALRLSVKSTAGERQVPLKSEVVTENVETKEKPKISREKSVNRPIAEVVDDIYDLESKYLFKGFNKDPICKYCYKSDQVVKKCSKNCNTWLHESCLEKENSVKDKHVNNKPANEKPSRRGPSLSNAAKQSTANEEKIRNNSTNDAIQDLNDQPSSNKTLSTPEDGKAHKDEDVIICRECALNVKPKCNICQDDNESLEMELVQCNVSNCNKVCHAKCCEQWPQAKINRSQNKIASFRCPSHVCHICVSDDPKAKFQSVKNTKFVKCVKCPATYHMDGYCIPAGTQILNTVNIICPRHHTTKNDSNLNCTWCYLCGSPNGGGEVVCCEFCPNSVHQECINIPVNEKYMCDECESGRLPLYGELVWAKFNSFRWWPAIILPPPEIPKNILRKSHNVFEFVVRFFGTHDHGWLTRRRVYLYMEGDSNEQRRHSRTTGLEASYRRALQEAKHFYEVVKAKKEERLSAQGTAEQLVPQPYKRIKRSRPVDPVKFHPVVDNMSKCDCLPDEERPCSLYSKCINRILLNECNPKICLAGNRCENQMFEKKISPRLEVVYMKERGFGLVCREPISEGTFIIEYVGEIINQQEFQRRMQQKSEEREENFYFLNVEKDYIIDAGPKGNLSRFMNHSCEPNCVAQKWSVNGITRIGLFALTDIPTDTELTFNYNWDELLGNRKKECYCGTKKCAGYIGSKKENKRKSRPQIVDETTTTSKTEVNKIASTPAVSKIKSAKRAGRKSLKATITAKATVESKRKSM